MPIGPWGSFDECVAANQDKASPEGFCAWLEHKETGAWPSQASKLTPEVLAKFDLVANNALSEALKGLRFQAPETKSVHDIEIFASGTWSDNKGIERTWTEADLDYMVKTFKPGEVPLSVGHTSPEFNLRVATALGVPLEILQGEGPGRGQMALGWASKLTKENGKVIADFEGVPAPLADWIEGAGYVKVSSDISINLENPKEPILQKVALLGVEKPAMSTLAGLKETKIFSKHDNVLICSFSMKEGTLDKFTKDTVIKELAMMFQEGNADALTAIAVALGLDPQTASLANVLKAITDLKAGGGMIPEAIAEQKVAFAKSQGDLANLMQTVEAQQVTIAQFQRNERVAKYTKQAEGWNAIPGKPEEIGAQLAETEEKAGEKVAQMVVAQFQAANKAAETAGVLRPIGRAGARTAEDSFEKEVKALANKENLTYQQALAKIALTRPKEVMAFSKRSNGQGG